MNRKTFLSIPVVLIGALILAVLGMIAWIIAFIPVLLKPNIVANFNPISTFSEHITKRMVQAAMKGSHARK